MPGRVLPAGTYWFVVPGPGIVQIFSADRSMVLATLHDIAAQRLKPSDATEISVADGKEMQPETIVTWFYPERTIGHEFIYSRQETAELARNKQHTIVAGN